MKINISKNIIISGERMNNSSKEWWHGPADDR